MRETKDTGGLLTGPIVEPYFDAVPTDIFHDLCKQTFSNPTFNHCMASRDYGCESRGVAYSEYEYEGIWV